MRLLNVDTFELEEFVGTDIPKYAILSHTWTKDEVNFQEFPDIAKDRSHPRLAKVIGCCRQAQRYGMRYVWIDTFCIDKSSSAELSEAINSMYQWYEKSKICFVYLADVHNVQGEGDLGPTTAFGMSRWFRRGWTLQELLAPSDLEFFDSTWSSIGELRKHYTWSLDGGYSERSCHMAASISRITGIGFSNLLSDSQFSPPPCSVAGKMSWASTRTTTRPEDMAYSLLGVFDINMPLLYGEGAKRAFFRLQKKIIKQTNDHSIFAWGYGQETWHDGMLAESPVGFINCQDILPSQPLPGQRSHYTVTNMGIQIQLPVFWANGWIRCVIFNATKESSPDTRMVIPFDLDADGSAVDGDTILFRASYSLPTFVEEHTWRNKTTNQQLYLSIKGSPRTGGVIRRQCFMEREPDTSNLWPLLIEIHPSISFPEILGDL